MSYSDFKTIDDIKTKFALKILSGDSLFSEVVEMTASSNIELN